MRFLHFLICFFFPLVTFAQEYPSLKPPLGIPITPEIVELGRRLFFETQLSQPIIDSTEVRAAALKRNPHEVLKTQGNLLYSVSCSTCHQPDRGFSQPTTVAEGILNRTGTRNSPTLWNVVYNPLLFLDGRTVGLPNQALQPEENVLEMGDQTLEQVLNRLRQDPMYTREFTNAYGSKQDGTSTIDRNRLGHALASFQSTLISDNAPLDDRMLGNFNALSPEAEIGFQLISKANCMSCHTYPLTTDRIFHNDGLEYATRQNPNDRGRAAILPSISVGRRRTVPRPETPDETRAFKTATWRQLKDTGPYGHNGAMSLAGIVRHYNLGGFIGPGQYDKDGRVVPSRNSTRDSQIDSRIQPQGWTEFQEEYVKTFLMQATSSKDLMVITAPRWEKMQETVSLVTPTQSIPLSNYFKPEVEKYSPRASDDGLSILERQLITLTNTVRNKSGLPSLLPDPNLMITARQQSLIMTSRGMRHGFTTGGSAENIAYGQESPESVMNSWMNSRGHRRNILGNYTYCGMTGVQARNGSIYWTQQFR